MRLWKPKKKIEIYNQKKKGKERESHPPLSPPPSPRFPFFPGCFPPQISGWDQIYLRCNRGKRVKPKYAVATYLRKDRLEDLEKTIKPIGKERERETRTYIYTECVYVCVCTPLPLPSPAWNLFLGLREYLCLWKEKTHRLLHPHPARMFTTLGTEESRARQNPSTTHIYILEFFWITPFLFLVHKRQASAEWFPA